MSFTDKIRDRAEPSSQRILSHTFVTGIGNGTLEVEKFKFYVCQDYAFLIQYSRVLALAVAKAPSMELMNYFAQLLHDTLNTEMHLHRSYCEKLRISHQELEFTEPAPTTVAYTDFLMQTAYSGSFGEIVTALLPCQWGYCEIGEMLAQRGEPKDAPLYAEWIRMYSSAEFRSQVDQLLRLADELASQASPMERERMETAYLTSTRYEYMFWDMAYKQERWAI